MFTFILIWCVYCQNDNIKEICMICGDIVNSYCCRYYNKCCDSEYTLSLKIAMNKQSNKFPEICRYNCYNNSRKIE